MPTVLQYMALLKRDRKLRRLQEDKRNKNFSRSNLTLGPGERKPAAPDGENSASCEVGGRSGDLTGTWNT
jgi:hypothetical protein